MFGVIFGYFLVVFVAKWQFIAPMVAKCYTIWSCSSFDKQYQRKLMISYAFGVFSTVLASMFGVIFGYFLVLFIDFW